MKPFLVVSNRLTKICEAVSYRMKFGNLAQFAPFTVHFEYTFLRECTSVFTIL